MGWGLRTLCTASTYQSNANLNRKVFREAPSGLNSKSANQRNDGRVASNLLQPPSWSIWLIPLTTSFPCCSRPEYRGKMPCYCAGCPILHEPACKIPPLGMSTIVPGPCRPNSMATLEWAEPLNTCKGNSLEKNRDSKEGAGGKLPVAACKLRQKLRSWETRRRRPVIASGDMSTGNSASCGSRARSASGREALEEGVMRKAAGSTLQCPGHQPRCCGAV